MRPTTTILAWVLATGLASAQSPSVIQTTRATMNGVRDNAAAASNAALGIQDKAPSAAEATRANVKASAGTAAAAVKAVPLASKASAKSEVKTTAKPVAKTTAKPEIKVTAKPVVKTTAKPEVKAVSKLEVKKTAKPEVKVAATPVVKAPAKPEVKTVSKAEVKTGVKPVGVAAPKTQAPKAHAKAAAVVAPAVAPKTSEPKKSESKKSDPMKAPAAEFAASETGDNKPAEEDKTAPDKKWNANGKRDPFISPVVSHAGGSGCNTGKKCLEIGAINLRGIVHAESGFIAVVSNSMNKAYFLRENDPVFNGYVVKITGDSIVFQETLQDRMGKTFTREVVKKIVTPAV